MSGEDEIKAQFALLEKAAQNLREHFENVQIFASNVLPGEDKTRHFSSGSGNWFARYGQVKNWIVSEEERTRDEAREHD